MLWFYLLILKLNLKAQNVSQVKIEEQKKHDIQIEKIFKALSQNQKLEPSCDEEEEEEEIMNETSEEEELSQCPFSKREKKLFENNNEKISPVCLNILAVVSDDSSQISIKFLDTISTGY